MGNKYFDGKIENKNIDDEVDMEFINSIDSLDEIVSEKMNSLQISDALTEIFNVLRLSNKYIDETTPWILAKNDNLKDRLETVIYNLLESIRVCAVELIPFLTKTSENILEQINIDDQSVGYNKNNKYELNKPIPLFMRIDINKKEN